MVQANSSAIANREDGEGQKSRELWGHRLGQLGVRARKWGFWDGCLERVRPGRRVLLAGRRQRCGDAAGGGRVPGWCEDRGRPVGLENE